MATMTPKQLSLNILPHPHVRAKEQAGDFVFLEGSLVLKVDVPVRQDLNHGDRLLVTVADEDGTVMSRAYAEVKAVTLAPIELKDVGIVGTERVHKAKQTDDAPPQ
jgi:hypothetical protein